MGKEQALTDRRMRGTAVIVLASCVALGLFPLLLWEPGFKAFFYVWYALLGLFTLKFLFLFIRNPRFTMRIEDGRLLWHDGVNPHLSGSADCAKIATLRVETHDGSEVLMQHVYLILTDGQRVKVSENCLPRNPDQLWEALRAINPGIKREEIKS